MNVAWWTALPEDQKSFALFVAMMLAVPFIVAVVSTVREVFRVFTKGTPLMALGLLLCRVAGIVGQASRWHNIALLRRDHGPRVLTLGRTLGMIALLLLAPVIQVFIPRLIGLGVNQSADSLRSLLLDPQALPYYAWAVLVLVVLSMRLGRLAVSHLREEWEVDRFAGYPITFGFGRNYTAQLVLWPLMYLSGAIPFLVYGFNFGVYLVACAVVVFGLALYSWAAYKFGERRRSMSGVRIDPFQPGQGRRRPGIRKRPIRFGEAD